MTHEQHLEAYHELVSKCLPGLALSIAKGEFEFAALCMSALQKKTDELWAQRVATAGREVAP